MLEADAVVNINGRVYFSARVKPLTEDRTAGRGEDLWLASICGQVLNPMD
jgi:hypothetical protein